MEPELKIKLAEYLKYLMEQPETRLNNSLIDCTILLMQETADVA